MWHIIKPQFLNNKINTKTANYNILKGINCAVNNSITLIPIFYN